jgi:hypothetical protein
LRKYRLTEVARLCEGVHISTVWRWIQKGVGGVRLQSVKVGGQRYVFARDLDTFMAKINGIDDASESDPQEQRDDLAMRLKQAGV